MGNELVLFTYLMINSFFDIETLGRREEEKLWNLKEVEEDKETPEAWTKKRLKTAYILGYELIIRFMSWWQEFKGMDPISWAWYLADVIG